MLGATIIVMLPKLLDDMELFRYGRVGAGGAGHGRSAVALGVQMKRVTPQQVAIPVVGSIALAVSPSGSRP